MIHSLTASSNSSVLKQTPVFEEFNDSMSRRRSLDLLKTIYRIRSRQPSTFSGRRGGEGADRILSYRFFSSTVPHHTQARSDNEVQWTDWFRTPEYRNAWSDDITPLSIDPVLDRQSRFLLDLLNRLYQVGLSKTADRVTTERINSVLNKLEAIPSQSQESMWQRAERSRVLLEAMELFEELRGEKHLPLPLPLPNHETYWRTLRMYGSKYLHGTKRRNAPKICYDIVCRMQDSNRLELQPTALHWNQVLSAYANSSDEERPLHAAQLLYEIDSKGMADASSFSHALRACVSIAGRSQQASAKFEELAIKVSERIWKGLKQNKSIESEPFHFMHMLRVSRNFPSGSSRDAFADKIFREAIDAQKVNVHVLNEMIQVSSHNLLCQLLGKSSFPKDPLKLIHQVPREWIENVDEGGKSPFEW